MTCKKRKEETGPIFARIWALNEDLLVAKEDRQMECPNSESNRLEWFRTVGSGFA